MRITGAESVFLLIPPLFFNETPNVLFLFFLSEEAGFTEAAGNKTAGCFHDAGAGQNAGAVCDAVDGTNQTAGADNVV